VTAQHAAHRAVCRPARGASELPPERDVTERWLVDAAYFPGGHAERVFAPRSEAEVAAVLAAFHPVLTVGAMSSLTGGATPHGGAVMATDALSSLCIDAAAKTVCAGAGVALLSVQ